MNEPYRQEEVVTLGPNRKYCHACASILDARAELCPRCGVRQLAAPPPPMPVQLAPQVMIVANEKSAGVAALLALLFGPLGMLYSTVLGAVVMFFINVFVLVGTAGLGLLITMPMSAIWAANAASQHNQRLRQAAMLSAR